MLLVKGLAEGIDEDQKTYHPPQVFIVNERQKQRPPVSTLR